MFGSRPGPMKTIQQGNRHEPVQGRFPPPAGFVWTPGELPTDPNFSDTPAYVPGVVRGIDGLSIVVG